MDKNIEIGVSQCVFMRILGLQLMESLGKIWRYIVGIQGTLMEF